ncbi:MAG TPA: hypothetical protein VML75_03000 [Kofleriaceae bacterium]|nr:hypothetical protein [Kofleriaceae bacterium]
MKPHHLAAAITVLAVLGLTRGDARADVLSLNATVQGGGAGGSGISGDAQDAAFHEGTAPGGHIGPAYGVMLGVEFLFIDGWVEHTQYRDGEGLTGTWTQFMAGVDIKVNVGEERGGRVEEGKRTGDAYHSAYVEMGLGTGFGVGTGQQVMPPLDNAQVTDKGFLVQASFGLGYRLNRVISLGVRVPVQAGYMFKNGVANDEGNQYISAQAAVLLGLRFDLQLK